MKEPDRVFRRATRDDVSHIVRMLADDALGARREAHTSPLPESYYKAFGAIDRDPNNELVVAEIEGAVSGVFQMEYLSTICHNVFPTGFSQCQRQSHPSRQAIPGHDRDAAAGGF
jgi:hypothetical protein